MNTIDRILELVEQRGLSQKQFAQQLNIRPQAITEWKKGTTSSYLQRIQQIAEILGTSVDYLLLDKHQMLIELTHTILPEDSYVDIFETARLMASNMVAECHGDGGIPYSLRLTISLMEGDV